MQYTVPGEVIDEVLAYLGKCPYVEVYVIVNKLRLTMQPVPQSQPEGGDVSVQSNETQNTQSQATAEGGQQSVSQEPENNNQG